LFDFLDAFQILAEIHKEDDNSLPVRVNAVLKMHPIKKVAFDSRRVDQDAYFNPRRNLQYYHRSEPFVSKEASEQIRTFFKLKTAADSIRDQYVGHPAWLDSYSRVLCASLDRTLRLEQKDGDYGKPQLDYLQELLDVRYRLKPEDIEKMSHEELRQAIIKKDENLMQDQNFQSHYISKTNTLQPPMQNVAAPFNINLPKQEQQDSLMEKLFGNVKATKDNKFVKRNISITIEDQILDEVKGEKQDNENKEENKEVEKKKEE